jgi:hypothetical protein
MKKYVNIKIEGENSIGVINLGKFDAQTSINNIVKTILEPKLIEALQSHFDCPVKIKQTEVLAILGYIHIRTTVVVESDGEDHEETVELEETWIY